jgi:hypothetical protein
LNITQKNTKTIDEITRQNTLRPSPPAECAGRDVHQADLLHPFLVKKAVVFALRRESHVSSSGVKVLSVLENTDQRYAL